MIAHVVTYTRPDEDHDDEGGDVDVLCYKRDGTMPAVFADEVTAEGLAQTLRGMFPDVTYQVQAVEL